MSEKAVDVPTIMKQKLSDITTTYTERDVMLYALTVGAAEDPLDDTELPLVYELAEDFRVLPTFAVVFPFAGMEGLVGMEGLRFNPMMLLHGEQEVNLKAPIPTSGTVTTKLKIAGVYDKGKGALIHLDAISFDEGGAELCTQRSSIFIRGIGGFGGDRGPKPEPWVLPKRAPDASMTYKTAANLALSYRLNGDPNPLHADPSMAAMGGFDKPILHGLASFGVAGRCVLKKFCDNDVSKFKGIKGRFAKHVFPGETLVTDMWKVGNKVLYTCRVAERDSIVITNGVVTLEGGDEDESKTAGSAAAASESAGFFEQIKAHVESDGGEMAKKLKCVIRFKLSDPDSTWTIDLKNGKGSVFQGGDGKADLTVMLSDANFLALASEKLNPQQAFMRGKLKIKGNMGLAMKLGQVMKAARPKSKL